MSRPRLRGEASRFGENAKAPISSLPARGLVTLWRTWRQGCPQGLARPLPALVIADLLGVPREDRATLQVLSDGLAAGMVLSAWDPAAVEGLKKAHRSQLELTAYFRDLIAHRRSSPQHDLLTALIEAEDGGKILDDDELISMCLLLLFAGHETATHLIGNGLLALLEHPRQLQRLRAEPELIVTAVEEFLRSPVQATGSPCDRGGRDWRASGGSGRFPDAGHRGCQPRPSAVR